MKVCSIIHFDFTNYNSKSNSKLYITIKCLKSLQHYIIQFLVLHVVSTGRIVQAGSHIGADLLYPVSAGGADYSRSERTVLGTWRDSKDDVGAPLDRVALYLDDVSWVEDKAFRVLVIHGDGVHTCPPRLHPRHCQHCAYRCVYRLRARNSLFLLGTVPSTLLQRCAPRSLFRLVRLIRTVSDEVHGPKRTCCNLSCCAFDSRPCQGLGTTSFLPRSVYGRPWHYPGVRRN